MFLYIAIGWLICSLLVYPLARYVTYLDDTYYWTIADRYLTICILTPLGPISLIAIFSYFLASILPDKIKNNTRCRW